MSGICIKPYNHTNTCMLSISSHGTIHVIFYISMCCDSFLHTADYWCVFTLTLPSSSLLEVEHFAEMMGATQHVFFCVVNMSLNAPVVGVHVTAGREKPPSQPGLYL